MNSNSLFAYLREPYIHDLSASGSSLLLLLLSLHRHREVHQQTNLGLPWPVSNRSLSNRATSPFPLFSNVFLRTTLRTIKICIAAYSYVSKHSRSFQSVSNNNAGNAVSESEQGRALQYYTHVSMPLLYQTLHKGYFIKFMERMPYHPSTGCFVFVSERSLLCGKERAYPKHHRPLALPHIFSARCPYYAKSVSYTHLRAHETREDLDWRLRR